jgi:hypothetical protein
MINHRIRVERGGDAREPETEPIDEIMTAAPPIRIGAVLDTSPITSNKKEFSHGKLVIHLVKNHMSGTGTPDPRR